MATTNFVNNTTLTDAEWFDDVDTATYPLTSVAGTNTITATGPSSMTAYNVRQRFVLIPANANTGATTINISSLGAKDIYAGNAACVGGELAAGVPVWILYDGTRFHLSGVEKFANPSITTQALTDGASVDWNMNSGAVATWTIGGNRILNAPTNLKAGGRYVLKITQDGTGGRAVTWNAVFKKARFGSVMPQPDQTASAVSVFEFYSDGTNLYLINDGNLVQATEQATTSGTSIDFTGIPSWVKKITILLDGVSTNGTQTIRVQIGDSGGVETSGYDNGAHSIITGTACSAGAAIASGFALPVSAGAGVVRFAVVELTLMDASNTWLCSALCSQKVTANEITNTCAMKQLSATLDRVRLTADGVDTFDAGSMNIVYQG